MQPTKRELGRLPSHDYASNSCYFVTTCTFERQPFLAYIDEDKLVLTDIGEIVRTQISWLEKQYPYIQIRTFAIMPDHIHVLIKYSGYSYHDKIKIKPLSEIVGALKMTSAKLIHLHGLSAFRWQYRFYDSIIRNKKHYHAVQRYIRNNPNNYLKKMSFELSNAGYRK